MLIRKSSFFLALMLFLFSISNSYSQTFGFGCLGLFGGYGGAVYQSYNAQGFNNYIKSFNADIGVDGERPLNTYDHSLGYRVGVNFFRANWQSGFMITAKGYFQGLSKTNEATKIFNNEIQNFSYDLDMKNWALGIDFGFAITKFLSWKIVDGTINFNNVSLTETVNMPGETIITEYKSESGIIGYSVSSGFIINIIANYISLEGSAGYTYLQIDDLKADNGNFFLKRNTATLEVNPETGNFIESGGFLAVVQLNIGFPL